MQEGPKTSAIVKRKGLKASPERDPSHLAHCHGDRSPTYIQVHLWVFPSLAFAQTLGFSAFKQLAPKSFLWVKPEEVGRPWVSGLASFLKVMPLS